MKRQLAETMDEHRLPVLARGKFWYSAMAYLIGTYLTVFLTDVTPVSPILAGFTAILLLNVIMNAQEDRRFKNQVERIMQDA